jgi:hypothetical protein
MPKMKFEYLKKIFKSSKHTVDLTSPSIAKTDKASNLFEAVKSMENSSNKISSWSFAIIGGSILCIVNSDYIHPDVINFKIGYALFIPGWLFLGLCLFHGTNISGRVNASNLYKENFDKMYIIFSKCNKDLQCQINWFKAGLINFGAWLILYLVWWIFFYPK